MCIFPDGFKKHVVQIKRQKHPDVIMHSQLWWLPTAELRTFCMYDKLQCRYFRSLQPVTVALYLMTHNHPQGTKGQAVTWRVTVCTAWQMRNDSLGRGGGETGDSNGLYIQFILKCDKQSTHNGLLWPYVWKGNKRSIFIEVVFHDAPTELFCVLTVLSLKSKCDSLGSKGNNLSWKSKCNSFCIFIRCHIARVIH